MKKRLVLTIRNLAAYQLILSDSKNNVFEGYEKSYQDVHNRVGYIYYITENKIVFSTDYLNQLKLIMCKQDDILQNLVPA